MRRGFQGGRAAPERGKSCLGRRESPARLGFSRQLSKCFFCHNLEWPLPRQRQRSNRRFWASSIRSGQKDVKAVFSHLMHAARSPPVRKPRSRQNGRRSWWRQRGGTSTARGNTGGHIGTATVFATFLGLAPSAVQLAVLPDRCAAARPITAIVAGIAPARVRLLRPGARTSKVFADKGIPWVMIVLSTQQTGVAQIRNGLGRLRQSGWQGDHILVSPETILGSGRKRLVGPRPGAGPFNFAAICAAMKVNPTGAGSRV